MIIWWFKNLFFLAMFKSETIRENFTDLSTSEKEHVFDVWLQFEEDFIYVRLCPCYLHSWADAPRDTRFYKKFFLTVNFPFTNLVIDAKFSFQVFCLPSFLNPWEVKLRGKRHVNQYSRSLKWSLSTIYIFYF